MTLAGERPDYWVATLECPDLTATLVFYELSMDLLARYFDQLAQDWRGWDGERAWESLEHDLSLIATHDGRGTVRLRVLLRTDTLDARGEGWWRAEASLSIDAGTYLTNVARAAKTEFAG